MIAVGKIGDRVSIMRTGMDAVTHEKLTQERTVRLIRALNCVLDEPLFEVRDDDSGIVN